MGSFYEGRAELAKRLIDKRGETCVLLKRAPQLDKTKPWVSRTPESRVDIKAVIIPHTSFQPGSLYQDGTTMKIGDKQLITYGVAPSLGDTIQRANGEIWIVAYVFDLNPGGVDILFDCGVRR